MSAHGFRRLSMVGPSSMVAVAGPAMHGLHAPRIARRLSTPAANAGGFDAEMTALYSRMASQHAHKDGPWPAILREVRKVIKDRPATVLDIASGPGQPALTLASAMPALTVLSTDASPDMTATAKAAARAAGAANMKVLVADAQSLPFEASTIDVVTCCYGFMFPEDKALAVREAWRVLKPGGVLVATTWDELDMLKIVRDVMEAVLGAPPPPPVMNPMSLSTPGLLESLLVEAGFERAKIACSSSTYPFDFGVEKDYQFKLATLLIRAKIDELGAHEVAHKAFWANIGKYTTTGPDGAMIMPHNTFKLTVATKAA